MSSHFLTDKSLSLEAAFGGWAMARGRAFAEPGVEPNYMADRPCRVTHLAVELHVDPVARTLTSVTRVRMVAVAGGPDTSGSSAGLAPMEAAQMEAERRFPGE